MPALRRFCLLRTPARALGIRSRRSVRQLACAGDPNGGHPGRYRAGWSTTDMAKRYQHVTDTIRATAAAQVGDLIWDTRTEGASELVTVSRDALVLVLQVVEAGLLNLDMDPDLAQFQAALTNLQTAMATPDNDANGEAKRDQTETSRPSGDYKRSPNHRPSQGQSRRSGRWKDGAV